MVVEHGRGVKTMAGTGQDGVTRLHVTRQSHLVNGFPLSHWRIQTRGFTQATFGKEVKSRSWQMASRTVSQEAPANSRLSPFPWKVTGRTRVCGIG